MLNLYRNQDRVVLCTIRVIGLRLFTLSILVSDCVIRELLLGEFTIDTYTHGGPIFMIIFCSWYLSLQVY